MIRRAALVAGLIVGCLPCAAHHDGHQALKRTRAGWPLMPFTLTDQHGRPFTQDRLTGRWTFMLFGDGASSERCDTALAALVDLHRRIARTQVLETTQVLLVWLEAPPQRDRLRDHLAAFDPRFIGATGPLQTLHALLDDLRSDDGTEPDTPRAGTLLLVGPDASRRAEYLPPFDVPWLTAAFLNARVGH